MSQSPTPVFTGRIEDGRIKVDRREAFVGFLGRFEGKQIDIRISKHRKDHSNAQRRFYHGVVVRAFAEFSGYEDEEVHEAFKHRFLLDRSDERLPRVRSTSSLNDHEYSIFIDNCIRLCAEMGCVIPDADAY